MKQLYNITNAQLGAIASHLINDPVAFDTVDQFDKFKVALVSLISDHCGGAPKFDENNEVTIHHDENLPEDGGVWAYGDSLPENRLLVPKVRDHNTFSLTGTDCLSDVWINIANAQIHIVPSEDSVVVSVHSSHSDYTPRENKFTFKSIENEICRWWNVWFNDVEAFITEQDSKLSDLNFHQRADYIVQYHKHCASLGPWNDEDRLAAFVEGWKLDLRIKPIKVSESKWQTVYPVIDSGDSHQIANTILNGTEPHHRKARYLIRQFGETQMATLMVDAKKAVEQA